MRPLADRPRGRASSGVPASAALLVAVGVFLAAIRLPTPAVGLNAALFNDGQCLQPLGLQQTGLDSGDCIAINRASGIVSTGSRRPNHTHCQ